MLRRTGRALLGFTALLFSLSAPAQNYPSQPIRLVVPFTPGTGMDMIARTAGPKLTERLKQPVIVENKPGASGNIGADHVAKSAPDGYTLMVSANTMLIASLLYRSVPFDPLKDFTPISLAAYGTLMLVANPATNIKSVDRLITRAKAQPGALSYGSPGVGTPHHMSMELLKDLAGVDLLHVPYKGSAGATTDVLSGQIDLMFMPIHIAMTFVKANKLNALAVGSAKRHRTAPDLPTLQESGIKGAEVDMWYAFLAPKGTPKPIVDKLQAELRPIMTHPDVQAAFDKQGMDARSSTPQELNALMQRDYKRWADVIKKNDIRAD
jgi:tripartite-type tricarboxylate transporter receptor subunit TctC